MAKKLIYFLPILFLAAIFKVIFFEKVPSQLAVESEVNEIGQSPNLESTLNPKMKNGIGRNLAEDSKLYEKTTEREKSFQAYEISSSSTGQIPDAKGSTSPANSPTKNTEVKSIKKDSGSENKSKTPALVIPTKDAKGAVHALYQAILWRKPDLDGGNAATHYFSHIGWSTYIENAKNMITSPEFETEIAPKHDAISIIDRIYTVFLARCPDQQELSGHLLDIERNEPGQITNKVLELAQQDHKEKIFKGGYQPRPCMRGL